jgi:hypothetical protein
VLQATALIARAVFSTISPIRASLTISFAIPNLHQLIADGRLAPRLPEGS